jgi:dUTP pyrophosphatase
MKIKILNENVIKPTKGSEYSAGIDIYSPISADVPAYTTLRIPLQIAIEINNDEVVITSERSSMGKKGIHSIGNIIDSDYRGEISIVLQNSSNTIYSFNVGDRIGQLLVHKIGDNTINFVDELSDTDRGSGGFGSTGK